MITNWMRFGYRKKVKFFADSDEEHEVIYYRAPKNAKNLPSPYMGLNRFWYNYRTDIGEVGKDYTWYDGVNRFGTTGQCFRGKKEWFERPIKRQDFDDYKFDACLSCPREVMQVGWQVHGEDTNQTWVDTDDPRFLPIVFDLEISGNPLYNGHRPLTKVAGSDWWEWTGIIDGIETTLTWREGGHLYWGLFDSSNRGLGSIWIDEIGGNPFYSQFMNDPFSDPSPDNLTFTVTGGIVRPSYHAVGIVAVGHRLYDDDVGKTTCGFRITGSTVIGSSYDPGYDGGFGPDDPVHGAAYNSGFSSGYGNYILVPWDSGFDSGFS